MPSTLTKRTLSFILGLTSIAAAQTPSAKLDNGILRATIQLPDPNNGFYRGTRFDWAGVIGDLTFAGHSFYGPWFTKVDPPVHDFIYDGSEIIAGKASAITGPVDEYSTDDGTALGFTQAAPGQTFVKIGVGALRKPDDKPYDHYRPYDLVDSGNWTVHTTKSSIQFTQKIVDKTSGYGYLYTKTLRLEPGKPVLVMEHSLKNLGRLPITTSTYNHNFLVLDHQPPGPDFSIRLPFTINPQAPIKADLGAVEGGRILYHKQLADHETFTVPIGGFDATPHNYDIRVENSRLGVGMQITSDQPLQKESLWSIRSVLAIEPFVHLTAAPGQTIHWSYTYSYYTLPTGQSTKLPPS
jgi:hypothetical protein